MSATTTVTEEGAGAPGGVRFSTKRLAALGRAEMTLLLRSRAALFVALFLPIMLTVSLRSAVEKTDLAELGLSVGSMLLPGSVGMVLLFVVYSNLVGIYVARREELVLKRLRTGEATDLEILTAGALPSVALGLGQCVLLLGGGAVVLDVEMPARPDLIVAGVVLGMVMMTGLAAVSAGLARTTEMSQIIPMPLMLISFAASGLFVPLDIFPDAVANICRFLPLTPLVDLLRGGFTGELGAGPTLGALGISLAWILVGVYGVRKRFRWEPRR